MSWNAQYVPVRYSEPGQAHPAIAALEAGIPDVGAVIFATSVGIALALHGRRALLVRDGDLREPDPLACAQLLAVLAQRPHALVPGSRLVSRTRQSTPLVRLTGRIWHIPVRLACHARKRILKISPDWPWKDAFIACWQRLCDLPAPS